MLPVLLLSIIQFSLQSLFKTFASEKNSRSAVWQFQLNNAFAVAHGKNGLPWRGGTLYAVCAIDEDFGADGIMEGIESRTVGDDLLLTLNTWFGTIFALAFSISNQYFAQVFTSKRR